MAYYFNGITSKKVLSVVQVKEVEVDYYVGVATLESEKQDEIIVPSYLQVNNTNFPILENTKTAIVEIGGNSVAFNQLNSNNYGFHGGEVSGITFTKNSDGTWTLNGTATANIERVISYFSIIANHKYLLKGCPSGGSTSSYWLACGQIGQDDIGNGTIKTRSADTTGYIAIRIANGTTINNLTFKPQEFDLTLMDLDNITSVAEFNALFPLDYYEYQENNIKSTILNKIESFDTNNTKLGQINLPNAPITLNGVNDIHDTLTFEEQENGTYNAILTRKIGIVDLGTLNWSYDSYNTCFYTSLDTALCVYGASNPAPNMLCSKYEAKNTYYLRQSDDKIVSTNNSVSTPRVMVKDTTYGTDATAFKSAMSGVYLYYELATPTTETIATGLTFDQVSTLFEKGGTLVIDNANSDYIQVNSSFAFAIKRFRSVEE